MLLRRIVAACPLKSKRLFSSFVSHDYASSIQELNKEMEFAFGETPPNGLDSYVSNSHADNEPHLSCELKRIFNSSVSHDYASSMHELNKEMEVVFGETPPNGLDSYVSNSHADNEPHLSCESKRIFNSSVSHDHASSMHELNKEMEVVFGETPPNRLDSYVSNSHADNEPHLSCESKRIFNSSVSHDYASSMHELNKEMEFVFGETLPNEPVSSVSNSHANNERHLSSQNNSGSSFQLTHTGNSGEAQMVDVSPKESSKRTATAVCKVILGKKVFDLVLANQIAKGDVLTVAKIAGITAAKQTSNLIPLCHNIGLTHVQVDLRLNHEDFSVTIEGEAASMGKTGVEMEAMTAVSVAGLTVYDMCKAASKGITITDIRLKQKSGGKSGDYFWGQ